MCKGPNWWVKIADFGISKRATEGLTALRTLAGTPAFMAPEIVPYLRKDGSSPQYTYTVDTWSLGVITFLILTGETLFREPARLGQYITGDFHFPSATLLANNVSVPGCDFVKRSMEPVPENRPSMEACRQHPWLQSLQEGIINPSFSIP